MNKLRNLFMVLVLVCWLAVAIPAAAEMDKKMEHGKSGMGHHEMKYGKGSKMGLQGGHGAKHIFGPHWREILPASFTPSLKPIIFLDISQLWSLKSILFWA